MTFSPVGEDGAAAEDEEEGLADAPADADGELAESLLVPLFEDPEQAVITCTISAADTSDPACFHFILNDNPPLIWLDPQNKKLQDSLALSVCGRLQQVFLKFMLIYIW